MSSENRALDPIRTDDIFAVLQKLRPRRFSGQKIRVGSEHDGGYVMPDVALSCDAVLSIGVGNDVSFDHAMAENGKFVLQFDHTLQRPPPPHENCLFEPRGWGATSVDRFVSLDDMASVLRKVGATAPMLKFDVESAEYDLLLSLRPGLLSYFPVIVCEVHDLRQLSARPFYNRAMAVFDILTADHAPVHFHANNYRDLVLIGGVPIPDVVELAFLRRDVGVSDAFQDDPIPGPLDRPNNPARFDLCLTPFSAHEMAI